MILHDLKALVADLEFLQKIRNELSRVRLIHEMEEQTFARVLNFAHALICKECRGYGHTPSGLKCNHCAGIGVLSVG